MQFWEKKKHFRRLCRWPIFVFGLHLMQCKNILVPTRNKWSWIHFAVEINFSHISCVVKHLESCLQCLYVKNNGAKKTQFQVMKYKIDQSINLFSLITMNRWQFWVVVGNSATKPITWGTGIWRLKKIFKNRQGFHVKHGSD